MKQGDLLAEIETPEIDQQLSQAVAARAQAASGLELARSTADRWEALRKKDVVSQQELDERRSAVAQATSNVAAADAPVLYLPGPSLRRISPLDFTHTDALIQEAYSAARHAALLDHLPHPA